MIVIKPGDEFPSINSPEDKELKSHANSSMLFSVGAFISLVVASSLTDATPPYQGAKALGSYAFIVTGFVLALISFSLSLMSICKTARHKHYRGLGLGALTLSVLTLLSATLSLFVFTIFNP